MRRINLYQLIGLVLFIVSTSAFSLSISAEKWTAPTGWEITLDESATANTPAQILLPTSLQLKILNADGTYTPVDGFSLDKTRWVNNAVLAGENYQIRYQIELAGITFDGEGIAFDGRNLYLITLWLTTPPHLWYNILGEEFSENKRFTFHNVQIIPDGKISGLYIDTKPKCAVYSYWVLQFTEIWLNENGVSASGSVYLNCNLKTFLVKVQVSMNRELLPQSGQIVEEFAYNIGKNGLLTIQDAELVFEWLKDAWGNNLPADSLIYVHQASYAFDHPENPGLQLELGNFTIDDRHVLVTTKGGFYLKPVPFSIGGVPHIYKNYEFTSGSSGIVGWVQVEVSPEIIQTSE